MTPSIAKALKDLAAQLESGETPESLLLDDREYEVDYDNDESGRFVEIWLSWPSGWFAVVEGGTWGNQESLRYYYEHW